VQKQLDEPLLDVRDIHKSYGEHEVLKGVSLTARRGNVISLIGSSGSGKSTLIRCINFLERPTSGQIVFAGKIYECDIGSTAPQSSQLRTLRRKTGMVFQSFNLWPHRTAVQNVMEGLIHVLNLPQREARERAEAYIEKVGLSSKLANYPSQLSGGQQQRIAIARALAMEPELMLFDEPTSALDPELVGEVLQVIKGLAGEGLTMVVVTHEMGFASEISTEVVYLREGKVEERGSPAEMFQHPGSPSLQSFLSRFRK